eukprot:12424022-Karenia_brevis.AAC.1
MAERSAKQLRHTQRDDDDMDEIIMDPHDVLEQEKPKLAKIAAPEWFFGCSCHGGKKGQCTKRKNRQA